MQLYIYQENGRFSNHHGRLKAHKTSWQFFNLPKFSYKKTAIIF